MNFLSMCRLTCLGISVFFPKVRRNTTVRSVGMVQLVDGSWPPSKKPPSLACVVCCIPSLSSLCPLAHWLVGLWPPHSPSTSRASCCVCRRIEAFFVWNGASVAALWTTLVRSTAMQPSGCFPQRRYRNGHRVARLAPSVSGMCSYHAHAVSRRFHGARWAQGWQRPRSTGGSVRVAT